jgi:hypothetical protein
MKDQNQDLDHLHVLPDLEVEIEIIKKDQENQDPDLEADLRLI